MRECYDSYSSAPIFIQSPTSAFVLDSTRSSPPFLNFYVVPTASSTEAKVSIRLLLGSLLNSGATRYYASTDLLGVHKGSLPAHFSVVFSLSTS